MVSTTETDGMHMGVNRHRTPDQILGPYFPMGHTPVTQADLTCVDGVNGFAQGEIIEVTGLILNLAGKPVRNVPVPIWQANTFGRYDHGNDLNPAPLDPNFVVCTGVQSDDDGIYRIKTIRPGAYPAGPDWMRPPHIQFDVHGRFERLITQMYFPDEPLNASDRLLNAALARLVLPENGCSRPVLNFDIVLSRG